MFQYLLNDVTSTAFQELWNDTSWKTQTDRRIKPSDLKASMFRISIIVLPPSRKRLQVLRPTNSAHKQNGGQQRYRFLSWGRDSI